MPAWVHSQLGRFIFDDLDRDAWAGEVEVPAFAAFTYTLRDGGRPFAGRHQLVFETDDASDASSDAAVDLARHVLANQRNLVAAVADALWYDLNGRGSPSGMWWHGNLARAAATERPRLPPLTSAEVPGAWLLPTAIVVARAGSRSEQSPMAELDFAAEFEREHNVGVLTDGASILGLGYEGVRQRL